MDNLLQEQINNEIKFNRNQEMQRIKKYFLEEDQDFIEIMEEYSLNPKIAVDFVAFMYECQHANLEMLVGHMLRFFNNLQDCLDWIYAAIDQDLVDYNGKSFSNCWTIPKSLEKEFELYQYPLPFLVEPRERKKNTDSSYFTIEKDSIFCGTTFIPEDCCSEILFKQDCIPLKLNMNIVKLTKNQWRSLVGGRKPDESLEHWKEKIDQFNNYDRGARQLVEQFEEKTFYLINKYDKRGRIYDQGYFIHSQGTDWNKACIEFEEEELVTE